MQLVKIEKNNERVLTTQQLAEIYGADSKNISNNFNRNKKYFKEGKHYFLLTGDELRKFKTNHLKDEPSMKRINQLYLWTERGASRHCKILDTDQAWKQFDNLEETYFRVRHNQPQSQLDILRGMIDQLEVAQREAREAKQIVQNIKDTIIHTDEDWRNWINDQFGKICREKRDYRDKKKQSYDILENRAHCRLSIRLDNLRDRMKEVGATDTAVKKACKLDVIEADPRLKEIYTMIVEKMVIKYSGGGSDGTLNRINSQKYPS